MNNSEFLWGLMKRADGSLQAWFDAEHADETNAIDGETNGTAGGITLVDELGEITHEVSELMKKQPYTFDVNDVQGSIRLAGRYIDELTAERDEWKAKAEHYGGHVDRLMEAIRDLAQKQPRTFDPEAPYKNAELVAKYIDELEAKVEQAERAMNAAAGKWAKAEAKSDEWKAMYLGTANDAEDYRTLWQRSMPTLGGLFGVLGDEEPHGEPDSREKLEAEVDNFGFIMNLESYQLDMIRGWLDRQKAITERDVRTYLNREDSELIQAKVDNLQGQIEHLREEIAKRDKGIARLKRQRDEARAQLENLATDLAECGREREIYRDACVRLLDLADEMRLVSLDGCGAALVDERGEVVS